MLEITPCVRVSISGRNRACSYGRLHSFCYVIVVVVILASATPIIIVIVAGVTQFREKRLREILVISFALRSHKCCVL